MRNWVQVAQSDRSQPIRPSRTGARASLQRGCTAAGLVALALGLIPAQLASAGAEGDGVAGRARELAGIEQRMRDQALDLDASRARREDLLAELEQRERDIADLARSGRQLAAMLDEQEQAVEKLRAASVAEQELSSRERTALGAILRSVYAMGQGGSIRIFLDQEDPSRTSRVMAYYGILERHRLARIEAIAQRLQRIEWLRGEAEEQKARLRLLAQKQEETRSRMVEAQEARSALLSPLEQSIADRAQEVAELHTQARQMRSLIEQLERQAQALPEADLRQESLQQQRGRLDWPLADAPLLSHYGSPKGDGAQRWDGVVLGAKEGVEVRAVHHGRVAYADWLRGFGLLLIIEHDDGFMTLYGHNQTLLKEPGEWVAAGDAIALTGSSGGRGTPGLYFAIRHRGRPLNPEQWCEGKVLPGHRPSSADPGVVNPEQPDKTFATSAGLSGTAF